MIVVTDTSPLCYLVQIDAQHLLQDLWQNVVCPETVLAECRHPRAPEKLRLWAQNPPQWLYTVADSAEIFPALRHLDPGERAAIQTACDLGAKIILLDEKKGRQAAESLGLVPVGVLGILCEASRSGMIDFEQTVDRLLTTTNFRVSDTVLERARAGLK